MNKSESIGALAKALVQAQAEIGAAAKRSSNPFFKSKYADLGEVIEAVKEPLNKHGIAFLQIVDESETGAVVETTLVHESGEFISGRTPVLTAKPNDPQAMGSAITYSKRYGLQALLGLPTEDDDGEAAMSRKAKVGSKSVTDELVDLVKSLGKSDVDVQKMREFVKAPAGSGLSDLSESQAMKLIGVLRKQLR